MVIYVVCHISGKLQLTPLVTLESISDIIILVAMNNECSMLKMESMDFVEYVSAWSERY